MFSYEKVHEKTKRWLKNWKRVIRTVECFLTEVTFRAQGKLEYQKHATFSPFEILLQKWLPLATWKTEIPATYALNADLQHVKSALEDPNNNLRAIGRICWSSTYHGNIKYRSILHTTVSPPRRQKAQATKNFSQRLLHLYIFRSNSKYL